MRSAPMLLNLPITAEVLSWVMMCLGRMVTICPAYTGPSLPGARWRVAIFSTRVERDAPGAEGDEQCAPDDDAPPAMRTVTRKQYAAEREGERDQNRSDEPGKRWPTHAEGPHRKKQCTESDRHPDDDDVFDRMGQPPAYEINPLRQLLRILGAWFDHRPAPAEASAA
jgi:hypothetical protein